MEPLWGPSPPDSVQEFVALQAANPRVCKVKVLQEHVLPLAGGAVATVRLVQLSVFCDPLFRGLQHFRRGHTVEVHHITAPGAADRESSSAWVYAQYRAHPKFFNKGESARDDALVGAVRLEEKWSGSMALVCCPARTITAAGVRYPNPLTPFVLSKNGYGNKYADAAAAAVQGNEPTLGAAVTKHLAPHRIQCLVGEVMGVDEHVYADSRVELVVHGVWVWVGDGLEPCELQRPEFPELGLPAVRNVPYAEFPTWHDALARFMQENGEAPPPPGSWPARGEGYVANNGRQRLKLKFWRYLVLREFREVRGVKCCPSADALHARFATWRVPPGQWAHWSGALRAWWVHVQTSNRALQQPGSPYIAARDAFLHGWRAAGGLPAALPGWMPLVLALMAPQCAGKSTWRAALAPYALAHGSQDEHGSVDRLAAHLAAAVRAAPPTTTPLLVVDRCNRTARERANLERALHKAMPGSFQLEYVRLPEVPLRELAARFAARRPGEHGFCPQTVGMLAGLDILREAAAQVRDSGYPCHFAAVADVVRHYGLQRTTSREADKASNARETTSGAKAKSSRASGQSGVPSVHGIGVPLEQAEFGATGGMLRDMDTACLHFMEGAAESLTSREAVPPDALMDTGTFYGNRVQPVPGHDTLAHLPEGTEVLVEVCGWYALHAFDAATDTTGRLLLSGLSVRCMLAGSASVPMEGRILLFCAPGVPPDMEVDTPPDGALFSSCRFGSQARTAIVGYAGTCKTNK